jgi:hypothetical protein
VLPLVRIGRGLALVRVSVRRRFVRNQVDVHRFRAVHVEEQVLARGCLDEEQHRQHQE